MMLRRLIGLVFFACAAAPAQNAGTRPSGEDPVIRVSKDEVVVDVVVRDKKGHILHNLKTSDFTLTDNQQPQTIVSFREVSGNAPAPVVTSAPGAASTP